MMKIKQVSLLHVLLCIVVIPLAIADQGPKGRELLPRRISSQIMDLGKAYPVYMVAGMATLVILPGPVTGIRTGNPDSIQYFRPDKPENEVTIVLKNQSAKPTNLILRSGQKIYVFDVVPSKSVHQDVLEVVGDFGGAQFNDTAAELLDSSETPKSAAAKRGVGK